VCNYNGTLTVINSTFFANTPDKGGGIFNIGDGATATATATITNTIMAGANVTGSSDYFQTMINGGALSVSGSNDLVQRTSGTEPFTASLTGVDPLLQGLIANGGPTKTMALLLGSPAIGAGTTSVPGGIDISHDQRGVARNLTPPNIGGVDIGAYQDAALTTRFAAAFTGTINAVTIGTAATGLNGDYVAVGSSGTTFAVSLYDSNGNLLASNTTTPFSGQASSYATAVAISGGTIFVAGNVTESGGNQIHRFGVASFTYTGSALVQNLLWPTNSVLSNFGDKTAAFANGIAVSATTVAVVGSVVGGNNNPTADFAILELNTTDGHTVDTFGSGGQQTLDFFGQADGAEAAIFESSGKLDVAGYAFNVSPSLTGHMDFALARYNTNGTLDTTFNSGGPQPGTIATDFGLTDGYGDASAQAIAIDPSNNNGNINDIVLAGYTVNPTNNPSGASLFAVARYTSAGILDTTFDSTGTNETSFGSSFAVSNTAAADGIIIQGSGASAVIDLVGYFFNQSATPNYQIAIAQYHSLDGSLDTGFNPNSPSPGRVTTAFLNAPPTALSGWAQAAAIVDATHFVVAGGAVDSSGTYNLAVAQYDPPPSSTAVASVPSSGNIVTSIAPVRTIGSVSSVGELIHALVSAERSPLTPGPSPARAWSAERGAESADVSSGAKGEGSRQAGPILGGLDPLIDATADGDWTDRNAFFKEQPPAVGGQPSAEGNQESGDGSQASEDREMQP
jgi:uncharacterized delta-60 repeat protein